MKTISVYYFIFIFLILAISGRASDNAIIFSIGINRNFSTAVSEQSASKPGFIDAYSASLQYNRQISGRFGAGLRTMFHNFNAIQEESANDASIPVFFTLNYRLFEMDGGNYIQLAVGPDFHLTSDDSYENEELRKSFETGYGLGIFSGYSFGFWDVLGVYAEGGLLYEKYSFMNTVSSNSNVTALLSLGFTLNY